MLCFTVIVLAYKPQILLLSTRNRKCEIVPSETTKFHDIVDRESIGLAFQERPYLSAEAAYPHLPTLSASCTLATLATLATLGTLESHWARARKDNEVITKLTSARSISVELSKGYPDICQLLGWPYRYHAGLTGITWQQYVGVETPRSQRNVKILIAEATSTA